MKQISFTRGVARGFSFLVLAMLILGGMNALVMTRITTWMDHLVDLEEIDVRQGQEILHDLGMMHRTLKNLIISPDPQIMDRYSKVLTEMDGKIREGMDQLGQRMGPESNALLAQFRTAYAQYAEIQGKVLELARQHSDQRAALLSRGEAQQAMDLALAELDRLAWSRDGAALPWVRSLERELLLLQRAEKNALLARNDQDLSRIEQEMDALENRIARRLREQRSVDAAVDRGWLDGFENRLHDYGLQRKQVLALARQRSHALAFEISIGEGRHRLDGAEQIMNTILANIDQQVASVRQQAKDWVHGTFLMGGIVSVFTILASIITAIILLRGLTDRVRTLSGRAISIAMGIIPAGVGSWPRDELTAIDGALNEIVGSYKLIAQLASRMAEGEHPQQLPERSPEDLLIRSINRMIEKSESVVKQVHAVAQGHFSQVVEPVSERDVLGLSLARMTDTLRRMDEERRRQLWLEEGYGRLNEVMREEHPLPMLATHIVTFLCQHLHMAGGFLHLVTDEGGGLQGMGRYLLQWPVAGNVPVAGVASQAALSRTPVLLTEIGEHQWAIPAGFGEIRPTAILAYPLLARHECRGVLELASLRDFSGECLAFLARVSESIAITLEKVRFDQRMRQTLDAAQSLAKELEEANQRHVVQAREMFASSQELRETRDELRKQAEELRLSGQYKSAFMATMSHEIRTPMNGILGTLQLLEQTPVSPEQKSHITTISRSARALLTLLNDLLDLSSIEAGKLLLREETFALPPLLDDVINLFRPKARDKGLTLHMAVADGVPGVVRGDAGRLRQILLNLLGNAVKFTTVGGVVVRVAAREQGAKGEQEGEKERVRLRFEVRDTGMGIDPRELSHLFQPFVQADAVRHHHLGGTGLGLSICQGLVTAMAGEIGVESTTEAGACFWFEIPLARAARAALAVEKSGKTAPLPRLGLEVLLVEDEETNRHVAEGMLRLLGCTIQVAETGPQALHLFREHPVEVVMLDMQLPGMDGLEVADHLRRLARESGKAVALVAMTALTMPSDMARYQQARLDGFVAKPILLNKLARELARFVGEPPRESPLPLLDPSPLALYRQDLPADQVRRIVEACHQSLQQGAGELARAWQDGELLQVARTAHRLKGAASANGLVQLAQAAEVLEQRAKRQQAADLAPWVEALLELVPRSLRALDEAGEGEEK